MTRQEIEQAVKDLVDKIEQSCFDAHEVVEKTGWLLEEVEISHQAAKEGR